MICTTEAIVLHSRKFSDSSSIVTLYTKEYGRISVVAKGSRKLKSKFGSSLLPLCIVEATYYYKPGRELHTLSGCEAIHLVGKIHSEYEFLASGLAIAESILSTQMVEEQNSELYVLLRTALEQLNAATQNPYSYFVAFTIHLAELMGFMIDTTHCAETGMPIRLHDAPEFYFSLADGAPYHPLESGVHAGYRVTASMLRALNLLRIAPMHEVGEISLTPELRNEFHMFFTRYFSQHLEKRFLYKTTPLVLGTSS